MSPVLGKSSEPRRGPMALFLPSLAGGGAERVTLNLARTVRARGYEVDLVVASATGPFVDSIPEGVNVVNLGHRRTLAALPALARYLRRCSPACLLSALNHANMVALWAASIAGYRGRVVVVEHSMLPPPSRSVWQRAFNTSIRWSYPRAYRVVAVSHGVKQSLITGAGISAQHVEVIFNPVIGTGLRTTPRPRPPELPLDGVSNVVAMGRLTRAKNFANLLHAFAVLRARLPARLLILGEGEARPALEDIVQRLGLSDDVSLPGFVPNAYDYLANADLFTLSSDWEGLPTVLIEALALGARVVATDCPSGPREILADGAYGALVPVGDSHALAVAMEAALGAPARSVPDEWFDQFSEASAVSRYLHVCGVVGDDETTSSSGQPGVGCA